MNKVVCTQWSITNAFKKKQYPTLCTRVLITIITFCSQYSRHYWKKQSK
jgi:hypothetical protein